MRDPSHTAATTTSDGKRRTLWGTITLLLMMGLTMTIGECYPFSKLVLFDRYADGQSRLLARMERGQIHRVSSFDNWACPRKVTQGDIEEAYQRVQGVATYLDRGALLYLDAHQGTPKNAAKVELVLRTLRFSPSVDEPDINDYVLEKCQADYIGMNWQMVKIWTIVRR